MRCCNVQGSYAAVFYTPCQALQQCSREHSAFHLGFSISPPSYLVKSKHDIIGLLDSRVQLPMLPLALRALRAAAPSPEVR